MADNNLQSIVQRMIDAGEPEDHIAMVIKAYTPAQQTPASSSGGIGTLAVTSGAPIAARGAMELATNPGVAKAGSMLGQISGGIEGALKAGPLGAAGGAWAGGRAGWFTGKLAQRLAAPVASGLEKAAPYAKALAPIAAAQGVGDLAQMAEPNRRDIGVLGIGPSVNVPGAEPPWLNAVLGRLYGRVTGK